MLKLALTVVAIALPDCINPSLIGGELFVSIGEHPRARSLAFTLGVLAVTFGFGLVFALGLGDVILAFVPKPGATVKYSLITTAGAVLVLSGVGVWIRRGALAGAAAGGHRTTPHGSPLLIGAGFGGFELLTAFPYFAAIALIIGSSTSTGGKLFLLLLYCVVYTLPLIAIVVALAVMGERGEAKLRPLGDWLLDHWPQIVGPLTIAIGCAVLTFGVVQLASI